MYHKNADWSETTTNNFICIDFAILHLRNAIFPGVYHLNNIAEFVFLFSNMDAICNITPSNLCFDI